MPSPYAWGPQGDKGQLPVPHLHLISPKPVLYRYPHVPKTLKNTVAEGKEIFHRHFPCLRAPNLPPPW